MIYHNITKMIKYYAVKKGRVPGIYHDWETTKLQTINFPGAVFKSFTNLTDANEFMQTTTSSITNEPKILCYTDGSNFNGIGGYGFVMIYDNKIKKYCGKVNIDYCTNNIAELTAIRQCIIKLQEKYEGKIISSTDSLIRSDSQYSINCITTWYKSWQKNNWKTKSGKQVENKELIVEILELLEDKNITFEHVYGHKGEKYNEMCDKLANTGRKKLLP
jgi:ribonuclease HI